MPIVRISLFPRGSFVRKKLAREITRLVAQTCKVPPESTWVLFEELPRSHWAMGGKFLKPPKKISKPKK